jgi:hypothetical protein
MTLERLSSEKNEHLKTLIIPIVLCAAMHSTISVADTVVLITPAEVQNNEPEGLAERKTLAVPPPPAPQITVLEPANHIIAQVPFPIRVRFSTSDGATVDKDSVRVEVAVGFFSKDVTNLVANYLEPSGINVPDAAIPKGSYNVRISVRDSLGRKGQAEQQWVIH